MTRLLAIILAKNEAQHLPDCLHSLRWASAVMVSDTGSTDETRSLAEAGGAMVREHRFVNFAHNRNLALQDAADWGAEWVLFVDADERVTPALAAEIQALLADPGKLAGAWIPRYNWMWGHVMQGGGWYPDHQLRLLKVGQARYNLEREVHEIVALDGPAACLSEHFFHYNYHSLAQFQRKQRAYLNFEARILHEQGIWAKPWTYLSMPLREFWRRYVRLQGYQDGWRGVQLCSLMAWYTLGTYVRLRGLYRGEG